MGFLAHVPAAIFVFVAMLVAAFAIAVDHKVPRALEMYETHIREKLERSEYIVTWFGLFYFVLPMISFTVVHDWTKTFHDCFSPLTMWLDIFYSCTVIAQLITFVGGIEDNFGRIMAEFVGVTVLLCCVFSFVMLKCSKDPKYDLHDARSQCVWALGFLAVFGFATLRQVQLKDVIPTGFESVALGLAWLGFGLQCLQPFLSIFSRTLRGDFDDDIPSTRKIKLAAALMRVLTLSYEVWMCHSKEYFESSGTESYAWMVIGSLLVSCFQTVYRYIGPRKFKYAYDAVVYWVWSLHRVRAVETVRRRNEEMSLEGHFGALSIE
ncbi:hypothetical protein ACP4OV_014586 [Aristida adscensionis]